MPSQVKWFKPSFTSWFTGQVADKKTSQRKIAELLGIEASSVSLSSRGKRQFQPDEVRQICEIFGIPINEFYRQYGIPISEDVHQCVIEAHISENGNVLRVSNGESCFAPKDTPFSTFALQVRSPNTVTDGWLLFASGSVVEPDLVINQLCVTKRNSGDEVIGVVRRGYSAKKFNLLIWPSGESVGDVELQSAFEVVWIKPSRK